MFFLFIALQNDYNPSTFLNVFYQYNFFLEFGFLHFADVFQKILETNYLFVEL